MALRELPDVARTSLLIFAVALGVRLTFMAASTHTLASDELAYHRLAESLAQNGTYAIDGIPTAYRPPGYPFVLSLVYYVVGSSPTSVQILQALADAVLAVLIFVSLHKRDKTAARVAGFSWALYPASILYSGLLLTETLFTAVLFGAIFILSQRASATWAGAAGALLGLACLIKPWLVIFVVLVFTLAVLRWKGEKQVAIAALVAALITIPWMARNSATVGVFALSTNAGMNLYVGNNPEATGGYKGAFPQEIVAQVGDERRLDSVSTKLALDYMAGEPGQFLVNAAKKVARLVGSEGELLVISFARAYPEASYKEKYQGLPMALSLLVNLPSFVFLVLGIAGLMTAEKTFQWHSALLLLTAIVVTTVVFFGSSRFRQPMMPFLVMYGSLVAAHPKPFRDSLPAREKALLSVAILLIIAVWITEALLIADA